MAIQDFGKKIGGAKKDLWKERGLAVSDLSEFNAAERLAHIKKDNVWRKPDYQKMVDEDMDKRVVYFIKLVRDSLPVKPELSQFDSEEETQKKQDGYISFVGKLRDAAMELQTEQDVRMFYQNVIAPYITKSSPYSYYVDVSPEAYGCITNKLLKCTTSVERSLRSLERDVVKKQFCYSEDEKILAPYEFRQYQENKVKFTKDYQERDIMEISLGYGTSYLYPDKKWMNPEEWKDGTYYITKRTNILGRNFETIEDAKQFVLDTVKEKQKDVLSPALEKPKAKQRKKAFLPKQLEGIERKGPDVREGFSVTGQDYLHAFGFRGGEFGNWLNEKDRQASLDLGYEAFLDLSRALGITAEDLSLGGRLSIAFGARGHGDALAHYETLREVINLTKMKGAGSLAHEWGHALDDIIGKGLGLGGMMSEHLSNKQVPESFRKLLHAMQYKTASKDEAVKRQKADMETYAKSIRNYLERFFPITMEETQVKEKETLIDALLSSAAENEQKCALGIYRGQGYSEIDALSEFHKEVTGRVIPKEERVQIAQWMNALRFKLEKIGAEMEVPTDFYRNSQVFDKIHSKTDHGYWQSNVEMFARAFACYVNDKLKAQGEQSDYLCGHSDMQVSIVLNQNDEPELIQAFPIGKEREIINQHFDVFFEELLEMELLHPLEKLPEAKNLEKYQEEKKYKPSLDIQITGAKEKISHDVDLVNKQESKLYEQANGQMQFIF